MTLATPRPVPNLVGETRIGDTIVGLSPDTKRVAGFTMPYDSRITKLSLACDGLGGAAPTLRATLRAVIYQGNVLVGQGDEVVVTSGDLLGWVDLPLTGANPDGLTALVAAGTVEFGVLIGGDAGVLRVAQIDPSGLGGRENADVYSDGASAIFGVAPALTASTSIFATLTTDWSPLSTESYETIAHMAFADAQTFLNTIIEADSPTLATSVTWHGTRVDRNRGSFAVVRAGGPFAGYVGQRLLVSTLGPQEIRTVIVYVFAALSVLDADLSLARRSFAQLELLAADEVDVTVQVLS